MNSELHAWTILCSLLIATCACAKESESGTAAELEGLAPPAETIVGPDAGEKLLFHDGRYLYLKVTPRQTGSQNLLVGSEVLPVGTAIPVHSHDDYEEVLFVHRGEAVLTLGDREVRAEPGTVMYVPPGTWHGVANAERADTTILFVFPRTEIEEFFTTVGFREGEKPPQLTGDDWAEIMARHRMRARPD